MMMPQQMYEDLLRKRNVDKFRWDAQICESKSTGDLDELTEHLQT